MTTSLIKFLVSSLLLQSCGAPTKSPADVAHIFNGKADTLQDKLSRLCESLENRSEAPYLTPLSLKAADCDEAGETALNFKNLDAFYFSGLEIEGVSNEAEKKAGEGVIHFTSRSQVWLGSGLVSFAASVSDQLNGKAFLGDTVSVEQSSFGGKDAQLIKPKVSTLRKPNFDKGTKEFDLALNFVLSGIVTADNDIEISGKIFDEYIAINVSTSKDAAFEKSIIQNFNFLIILVPHAQDIYVDLFLDLNVHNFGAETIVIEKLKTALSVGLKSALDGFLSL
jgi:hypothetical protein